jgi:hypothetical protein
MATYVEAGGLRLLIDPGATLAPRRYGLGPAPEEEEALARARLRIEAYAIRATHVAAVTSTRTTSSRTPCSTWDARCGSGPAPHPRPASGRPGREFWRAIGGHCRMEPAEVTRRS